MSPDFETRLGEAEIDAVLAALRSGWLTMGPRVAAFEEAFAQLAGPDAHPVALSGGAAALHLACAVAPLGAGDEVLICAPDIRPAERAVRSAGAVPVAVDLAAEGRPLVAVADLESAVGPRTRAVVLQHTWGLPAPAAAVAALCDERGLVLIEDVTQALGARTAEGAFAGAAGAFACFDFCGPSQLPVGQGGALVCRRPEDAQRVRLLRSQGMTTLAWDRYRGRGDSYEVEAIGFNLRLDEARAALATALLERLGEEIAHRHALVGAWEEGLSDVEGITVTGGGEPNAAPWAAALRAADAGRAERLRSALDDARLPWVTVDPSAASGPRARALAADHCLVAVGLAVASTDVERALSFLRR